MTLYWVLSRGIVFYLFFFTLLSFIRAVIHRFLWFFPGLNEIKLFLFWVLPHFITLHRAFIKLNLVLPKFFLLFEFFSCLDMWRPLYGLVWAPCKPRRAHRWVLMGLCVGRRPSGQDVVVGSSGSYPPPTPTPPAASLPAPPWPPTTPQNPTPAFVSKSNSTSVPRQVRCWQRDAIKRERKQTMAVFFLLNQVDILVMRSKELV